MNVLDLFTGIGGFSLGLERTGHFHTTAMCEIDPYCRRVLAKHWPGVPVYADVRTLTAEQLRADDIPVDVITAGFPCQDISVAGRNAGLHAERSGLWQHVTRLAGELRPRYVIMENVPALLVRGLGTILGDLATLGFDAEWHCIPAAAIGAPHRRDRIWIIAYADRAGGRQELRGAHGDEGAHGPQDMHQPCRDGAFGHVADADGARLEALLDRDAIERAAVVGARIWSTEPDVGRVAHGIPHRVDRLRALGNAIVPQIATLIGQAIIESEKRFSTQTKSPGVFYPADPPP